ncbi:helix-turn-helix domain-containing protein [Rhodoplanes sp. TEM]|uniref:Helix-turn-helix domain-containing protein n=1 Tax=Rhodoplanes tepidamans TaxID=200616 RepID=A0ABT5JCB7_RHOTP|nr:MULTISPECIES: helix-turn-helix domain-containing protein [Rhodoplanes]MDC7787335.1 helix-turn-helix domain-containing protein [Rhodoplanes tepidamans]MDC7984783.1 helix-turn-helix domain-containing protein [Rhodoplanes sp. TEM]MDQ0358246.1 hypothetical protein [Rhodoplanes tepidamans]
MSDGTVSIRMILRAVGLAWNVAAHKVRSNRRTADIAVPRHAVCLLASEMTGYTFAAIGRLLGDRDHTSIMHGVARGRALRDSDPDFAARFATARQIVLDELATADRWQDADAVEAARAVMAAADPWRAATDLSVDEVVAVAARAVALEEVAGGTYQLLALLDEFERLRRQPSLPQPPQRASEIAASVRALGDAIAEALQGLGYEYADPDTASEPKDETHGEAHQDRGPANAGAAE